jgi:hypothetical protein
MNSWKGEFLMTNTKKKHGNKMKLMSAIGMLTVSAAMLVSSTFAWFSMNKTVTASSMNITAKSDNTYLLIGNTNSAQTIQNARSTSLTWQEDEASLYPSSPALDSTEAGYLTTSGKTVTGATITTAGVVVDNATKAQVITNWFTANAAASNAATIDATTARQLEDWDGYVIHETMYLTVAKGANNAVDLNVTGSFTQNTGGNDLTAARMLVVTDDGGFGILSSASPTADISGSNTAITDQGVRRVDIYFFIDGDDQYIYTENATNLKGATMTVTFDVTPVPAS